MDLIWFYEHVLGDEVFVAAMVHVVNCENPECQKVAPPIVDFLHSNPDYLFEVLRALVACRDEKRGIGPF